MIRRASDTDMIGDLCHKRVKPYNTCHQILADVKVNPSPPTHLRNLYQNENGLEFLFSHFFVVPQKVLCRLKIKIEVNFFSSSGIGTGKG